MKEFLLIHGMKRSGNHAIADWLLSQGHFRYYNSPIKTIHLLRDNMPFPEKVDFKEWQRQRDWFEMKKNLKKYGFSTLWKNALAINASILFSIEDWDLDIQPFVNVNEDITNVLIVRNPYNFFASRIRKGVNGAWKEAYPTEKNHFMDRIVRIWKQHAREALGETNILNNRVPILFDRWCNDTDYRKQISAQLNLKYNDKTINKVSGVGGGSSFDGTAYNGNAAKMNVFNRKDQLNDQERQLFDEVFEDSELCELAEKIESHKD